MRIKIKLAFAILFVSMISLWVYHGTTSNQFVWDSFHYLFRNEEHISNLGFENIRWMLTSLEFYNWHPLTWFSWAIDYQVYGGLDSWGYHFSNNVIHSINSGLVLILILVIFELNNPHSKTQFASTDSTSILAATTAAVIFAVHPQHVESVAWVAERKDLLCQLFILVSLLTYVKYVSSQDKAKKWWFLMTIIAFFLALLAKPMAVTFPVLLLLFDIYPLRRLNSLEQVNQSIQQHRIFYLVLEKIPFLVLSELSILLTIQAQLDALKAVPFDLRLLNAFNSIFLYIQKLVVPLQFSPRYPYFLNPGEPYSWSAFVPMIGFLIVSVLAVIAWRKGHRAWLVAWLMYLVALSPVLGLIQVGSQGAADRYAYLPTLPAYVFLGYGLRIAFNHSDFRRIATLALAFAVIALLTLTTKQQILVWKNELSLWTQAVESYPESIFARENLAITHLNLGNYEFAAYHFEKSEELSPAPTRNIGWRGLAYLNLGRYEEALEDHINLGISSEEIPELVVDQHCIQYNIGWLYAHLNMPEEAIELMQRVLPNEKYRPDAVIWLEHLESVDLTNDGTMVLDGLPDYCKTLIPSRVWINGKLQR